MRSALHCKSIHSLEQEITALKLNIIATWDGNRCWIRALESNIVEIDKTVTANVHQVVYRGHLYSCGSAWRINTYFFRWGIIPPFILNVTSGLMVLYKKSPSGRRRIRSRITKINCRSWLWCNCWFVNYPMIFSYNNSSAIPVWCKGSVSDRGSNTWLC